MFVKEKKLELTEREKEIKYEKGQLHVKYLFILAGILAIASISIALGTDEAFTAQLSFASTVSSIILSVLAIIISISGEDKNSYVQNKMCETTDLMNQVATRIENASDKLNNKLSRLENLEDDLHGVKKDTQYMLNEIQNLSLTGNTNQIKNGENISAKDLVKIYKTILKMDGPIDCINAIFEYIVIVLKNEDEHEDIDINLDEVFQYLLEQNLFKRKEFSSFLVLWGMVLLIGKLGINSKNNQNVKEMYEEMKKEGYIKNTKKILSFREKWSKEH